MSDHPRSRFDRSERPPRSRFDRDRRSRSPETRDSGRRRTRSPTQAQARDGSGSPSTVASAQTKIDVAAAAAAAKAAADKINAQIAAKAKSTTVTVPPVVRPVRVSSTPPVARPSSSKETSALGEAYQQDGDFIQDIQINDLRNRYTLTKGAVQKKIKDDTGADVTTRGEYYPDKSMATQANPPLYLRVTSTSKESLDAAVRAIHELMQQDLPNLVDERRFRRREPEEVERDEHGRRKWPEEKLPVDLEPINGFNLRAQVVGRGGDNVKYIQRETSCRVQIKGRGSGFMEVLNGQESDEPMYLHITGPKAEDVAKAKQLCQELLVKIKEQYNQFKERPPQHRYGGDGYSNGRSGYGDRGGGDRDRSHSHSYGGASGYGGGYGGNSSYEATPAAYSTPAYSTPTTAATYSTPTMGAASADPQAASAAAAAWFEQHTQYSQYYAAYPDQDPYKEQGGYDAFMAPYVQYYASAGYGGTPAAGYTPAQPPATDAAPQGVPPPPAGSPPAQYNAVPPPPGM